MSKQAGAKDFVVEAINRALRAVTVAQAEANGDTRTSCSACCDYLDAAAQSLGDAAKWISELKREERANETARAPKPKQTPKPICHLCEEEIQPDDVAVCSGCDGVTCPECMGSEGACNECEEDV